MATEQAPAGFPEPPFDVAVDDGLTGTITNVLDERGTIGEIEDVEPGETTIEEKNARELFADFRGRWGDPPSRLFVSCDGGEVTTSIGPQFAPIETNVSYEQWQIVMAELGEPHRPEYRIFFEDAALVVFKSATRAIVTAPMQFGWETSFAGPDQPHCPPKPSTHDLDLEEDDDE